jgi:hypothetical protein
MFFPDPGRAEAVMAYVGEGSPSFRRTALDVPMCERTAYKVIQSLIEDGLLWVTPGIPGMTSGRLNASQWLLLTDIQRDRAATAAERIADALEGFMTSKEEQDRRREASLTAVEQRERTLVALERIADALERMAGQRTVETKMGYAYDGGTTTLPIRTTIVMDSTGEGKVIRDDRRGCPDGNRGPGREEGGRGMADLHRRGQRLSRPRVRHGPPLRAS